MTCSTASGGKTPYVYSVSPALPFGFGMSESLGNVGGIPGGPSTTNITTTVTDATGAKVSKDWQLVVKY